MASTCITFQKVKFHGVCVHVVAQWPAHHHVCPSIELFADRFCHYIPEIYEEFGILPSARQWAPTRRMHRRDHFSTHDMTTGSAPGGAGNATLLLIVANIVSSVAIVTFNKSLVESGFRFIFLLTSLHFFAGFAFLTFASSSSLQLFTRASAPRGPIIRLALAGAGSIALLNFSLKLNSVGTYQILKVAVLPAVMLITYLMRIATPSVKEVLAACVVGAGTLVCTYSDVHGTALGLFIGVLGVFSTAIYQIWQGSIQKAHGLNSAQAMYLMSLPQAWMALAASLVFETDWSRAMSHATQALRGGADRMIVAPPDSGTRPLDVWTHAYTFGEVTTILITCACAIVLNFTTISVIGRTSAVAMQFVNQLKTVLIFVAGYLFFHKPMSDGQAAATVFGLTLVFAGVAWYTRLKNPGPQAGSSPRK